jgi:hypothetical protein
MSDHYEFHPLAGIFPLMEGEEFDALVADIKAHGLREPIDLYQGKIIDGRNRYRALLQLGIIPKKSNLHYVRTALDQCRSSVGGIGFHGKVDRNGMVAYIVSKNIHRRHLTADQKRDAIAALIKAQPEKSNRQIAKATGTSHPHIGKVRAELEKAGDVETVTTSIDTKGRKQPAKKAKRPLGARRRPLADCPICEGTGLLPPFKYTSACGRLEFGGKPASGPCLCVQMEGDSRKPEFRATLQSVREEMDSERNAGAGNGSDPEASAERMKAAHAAREDDEEISDKEYRRQVKFRAFVNRANQSVEDSAAKIRPADEREWVEAVNAALEARDAWNKAQARLSRGLDLYRRDVLGWPKGAAG